MSGRADDSARNQAGAPALPPIVALAVLPDGKLLDSQFVVAASQAGLAPSRLQTGIANPHAVSFSPDGRSMLICGGEPGQGGQVEILDWPPSDGRVVSKRVFRTGEDSLYAASWSSDSGAVAVAGLDGFGRVLDSKTGRERVRLSGHSRGLTGIEFLSPQRLVTASLDGSLRVWDADSSELLRTLANHTGPVTGVCLGPSREPVRLRMAASIGEDRTVRLWQPEIGRMVRFVRLSSKPLAVVWLSRNVAADAHGGVLAVACLDGQVRLVAVDTVEVLAERPVLDGPAYCITADVTEETLFVAGHRGQIRPLRLTDLLSVESSAK